MDQAERTATFMAAEKQNKASTKTANTMAAMAKNLGPDSDGEDEEDGGFFRWETGETPDFGRCSLEEFFIFGEKKQRDKFRF